MRWDARRTRFNGIIISRSLEEVEKYYDPAFRLSMCLLGWDAMADCGFQTPLQLATSSMESELKERNPKWVVANPSKLPAYTFRDKVPFPGEVFDCTVEEGDPFYKSVKESAIKVEHVKVVKFRAREEMETPDEICTIGTVQKMVEEKGNVRLLVRAHARVRPGVDVVHGTMKGFGEDFPLVRNPKHGAFGPCAVYEEIRENFEKLIRKCLVSDDSVAVGLELLGDLEVLDCTGRDADELSRLFRQEKADSFGSYDPLFPDGDGFYEDLPPYYVGWVGPLDHDGTAGPLRFLDVTADFLASSLSRQFPSLVVSVVDQRRWLDILDPCERLRDLNTFIVEKLDEREQGRARDDAALKKIIEKFEREKAALEEGGRRWKYLDERIRDRRKQLEDPAANLLGRLEKCRMRMPGGVWKRLEPEIERLKEGGLDPKAEDYLDRMADLPWEVDEKKPINLDEFKKSFDKEYYGLEEAKERILEHLADAKPRALCLVGPSGTGKTSLARSIADILGRKLAEIPCDDMDEASDICGRRRGYDGARPGQIIRELRRVRSRNPVFVLDEIDKMSGSAGEEMLDVLDTTQNDKFSDVYLGVPFDLSQVFFVATAVDFQKIRPAPLRDRLEKIEIAADGYEEAEKFEIGKILVKRFNKRGKDKTQVEFDDEALRAVVCASKEELGVHYLEGWISKICTDATRECETGTVKVTKEMAGVAGARRGRSRVLDIEGLRGMIKHGGMPWEARAHGERVLDTLERQSEGSPDYCRNIEYLRIYVDIPWDKFTEERINLKDASNNLDDEHVGLEEAKGRILEYLAVRKRNPDAKGLNLCFVGPPGVGKTSLAKSIAKALGREEQQFAVLSCSGMSDATELRGHNRGWAGAQPGWIIKALCEAGVKNPVLVLDEIDKVTRGGGNLGNPSAALLEILDPNQNSRFLDYYIGVPVDLSKVFFVATANVWGMIPPPLQDRMEMIELRGYSKEEKFEIARKIEEQQIKESSLTGRIEFDDDARKAIIRDHSKEMGVRGLERGIARICRKVALSIEKDKTAAKVKVTGERVGEMLDPVHDEGVLGVEQLRKKIEHGGMPPDARNQGRRVLEDLQVQQPGSGEYARTLAYLQWLGSLPWDSSTEEKIDLASTKEFLDKGHSGLEKAKARILEYLSVRKLKPGVKGPILCFVGPPGVGKTSLAQRIAKSIRRKFARVSLGGMRDEVQLRGHSRTYVGSQPGRIVRALREVGVKNPVLVLDEIDKVGGASASGDPSAALLEILDPEQNSRFSDNYIEVPFDLSKVFFVATANVWEMISSPLRDRMEMIDLPAYTEEEKLVIATKHLIERQIEMTGLTGLTVEQVRSAIKEVLRKVIRGHTREAGVRNLEREIGALCRKVAHRLDEGNESPGEITAETVVEMLGAPKYFDEEVAERTKRPGVAIGLAWTPVGGDVLFVEARRMRSRSGGNDPLILTGNLGEVMKESAQDAVTWLRASADRDADSYCDDPYFLESGEVHLHVSSGAIPKDGPSAGVTMVAALASELTRRPVRGDFAMTGEIDLSGNVLRVGGIREKVLAARRLGIAEVVLPKQNEKDVNEDLDERLRREIKVHYVSTIEEVLALVLLPAAG